MADYCLVEVSQFVSSEVEERVMEDSECPLQQLEDLKEVWLFMGWGLVQSSLTFDLLYAPGVCVSLPPAEVCLTLS